MSVEKLIEGKFGDFLIGVLGFKQFVVISMFVIFGLTLIVWIYSRSYSISLGFLFFTLAAWNLYFGVIPSPYSMAMYLFFALMVTLLIYNSLKR